MGFRSGLWIKLTWDQTFSINRIVLFDKPNATDQIIRAELQFSDGTSIAVDDIPNNGCEKVISFSTKQVTWVKLVVNEANGENIGLSEIEVYGYSAENTIAGNKTNGTTVDVCDADLTFSKIFVNQPMDATSIKLNIAAPWTFTMISIATS